MPAGAVESGGPSARHPGAGPNVDADRTNKQAAGWDRWAPPALLRSPHHPVIPPAFRWMGMQSPSSPASDHYLGRRIGVPSVSSAGRLTCKDRCSLRKPCCLGVGLLSTPRTKNPPTSGVATCSGGPRQASRSSTGAPCHPSCRGSHAPARGERAETAQPCPGTAAEPAHTCGRPRRGLHAWGWEATLSPGTALRALLCSAVGEACLGPPRRNVRPINCLGDTGTPVVSHVPSCAS